MVTVRDWWCRHWRAQDSQSSMLFLRVTVCPIGPKRIVAFFSSRCTEILKLLSIEPIYVTIPPFRHLDHGGTRHTIDIAIAGPTNYKVAPQELAIAALCCRKNIDILYIRAKAALVENMHFVHAHSVAQIILLRFFFFSLIQRCHAIHGHMHIWGRWLRNVGGRSHTRSKSRPNRRFVRCYKVGNTSFAVIVTPTWCCQNPKSVIIIPKLLVLLTLLQLTSITSGEIYYVCTLLVSACVYCAICSFGWLSLYLYAGKFIRQE